MLDSTVCGPGETMSLAAIDAAGGAGDAGQLRLGGEAADRRRGLPPAL
jgi:hypothetical protein